jgi:hypothetical protein
MGTCPPTTQVLGRSPGHLPGHLPRMVGFMLMGGYCLPSPLVPRSHPDLTKGVSTSARLLLCTKTTLVLDPWLTPPRNNSDSLDTHTTTLMTSPTHHMPTASLTDTTAWQTTIEVLVLIGTLTNIINQLMHPLRIWILTGTVHIMGIRVIGIDLLQHALHHICPLCLSCKCFGWSWRCLGRLAIGIVDSGVWWRTAHAS